ncbi:MAG: hypothetical protein EP343_32720 [Deltaproteobacteria bacterium]|nr:MAG: hypothetical protein EP343_32720 [Deltaproteobacteria bacterium]
MRILTYATSSDDLKRCAVLESVHEVLLEPAWLAREGRLPQDRVESLAVEARTLGLHPILVWDILLPERVLEQLVPELQEVNWSLFDAVRVNDVGAAQWLQSYLPEMPLHWNVETGNHNLDGLQLWCELLAPSLERLVLSIELPEEKLIEYCQVLPVPCELLGAGRILLFYSPRSLLAKHLSRQDESTHRYEAVVASEHSNFKPMPTLETQHGTFLFLDKDQFVLDRLERVLASGLHTVRLDLRHLSEPGHAATELQDVVEQAITQPDQLRKSWPRPTRATFFKANNTTGQFSKMKAKHHAFRDAASLAEILTSDKPDYLVIRVLRDFQVSEAQLLMVPSGEVAPLSSPLQARTLQGELVEVATQGQILVTNWVKMACTGALLRREAGGG